MSKAWRVTAAAIAVVAAALLIRATAISAAASLPSPEQFIGFKVGADKQAAQLQMASDIEDPAFQSSFNVVKGSAPARTDVPDTAFDQCGKKAIKDLAEANSKGTLVGSMAHGHSVPANIKNAFYDVITRQFNGQIDSKTAVKELVAAVNN